MWTLRRPISNVEAEMVAVSIFPQAQELAQNVEMLDGQL